MVPMDVSLKIVIVDENPIRAAILKDGLREAGYVQVVIYFRTLADYRQLRALTESAPRFLVIGGGFIGSEIAAALTGAGCRCCRSATP